ncbi:MAG: hypothetical protein ACOZAO_02215 [Patescibacteria group bacterium]
MTTAALHTHTLRLLINSKLHRSWDYETAPNEEHLDVGAVLAVMIPVIRRNLEGEKITISLQDYCPTAQEADTSRRFIFPPFALERVVKMGGLERVAKVLLFMVGASMKGISYWFSQDSIFGLFLVPFVLLARSR